MAGPEGRRQSANGHNDTWLSFIQALWVCWECSRGQCSHSSKVSMDDVWSQRWPWGVNIMAKMRRQFEQKIAVRHFYTCILLKLPIFWLHRYQSNAKYLALSSPQADGAAVIHWEPEPGWQCPGPAVPEPGSGKMNGTVETKPESTNCSQRRWQTQSRDHASGSRHILHVELTLGEWKSNQNFRIHRFLVKYFCEPECWGMSSLGDPGVGWPQSLTILPRPGHCTVLTQLYHYKAGRKKIYHFRGRDDRESDHNDMLHMCLSLDISQIKTFTLLLVRDSKQADRCMPVLDISFPTNFWCKFLNDIVFRNDGCVSESGVSRVTTSLQREWPSPDSLQTFEAAQAVAQPLAEREAGFRSGVCMQPVALNH